MPNDLLLSGMDASSVGTDLVPIVPNNDQDLPTLARAIRCKHAGTAGDVRFLSWDGNIRTTDIARGEVLLVAVRRVYATGTTALGLEAVI